MSFFPCHAWLSLLIIRLKIALACELLASCPTFLQASSSFSKFWGCALADDKVCGAMPGRLPSVVGTGGVWRLATGFHLAVGPWVTDVVVVVGRCDNNDPIVWARLMMTRNTRGMS